MKKVDKKKKKASDRKAPQNTGGNLQNPEMSRQVTYDGIGQKSNQGFELSVNGDQNLERKISTNPEALQLPSSGNLSKVKVSNVGTHMQPSTERISKRQLDSDDEIPVNYDSAEEEDEDLGTFENAENPNLEKVDEKVTNLHQTSSEVHSNRENDEDDFMAEIFGSETSSVKLEVSNTTPAVINNPIVTKAKEGNSRFIPTPFAIDRRNGRKNAFWEKVKIFQNWKADRNTSLWSNRREKYDLLLQFEASKRGNARLAMLLSLPLATLPTMSYWDRISAWTDNIVGYIQDGVCWELFMGWTSLTSPYELLHTIPELNLMEVVIGQSFFYDLFTLCEGDPGRPSRSLATLSQEVVRDLLSSIWTRLINTPERRRSRKEDQRTRLENNRNGGDLVRRSYALFWDLSSVIRPRVPKHPDPDEMTYMWELPHNTVINLALNSYKLTCFKEPNIQSIGGLKNSPPIPFQYREDWTPIWWDLIDNWKAQVLMRGAISMELHNPVSLGGQWGLQGSVHIAETDEEWERMRPRDEEPTPQLSERVRRALQEAGENPRRKEQREDESKDESFHRESKDEPSHRSSRDQEASRIRDSLHEEQEKIINSLASLSRKELNARVDAPIYEGLPKSSLEEIELLELEFITRPTLNKEERAHSLYLQSKLSISDRMILATQCSKRLDLNNQKIKSQSSLPEVQT